MRTHLFVKLKIGMEGRSIEIQTSQYLAFIQGFSDIIGVLV